MSLILRPSFDSQSREEILAHLEQVRVRRMAAAIHYHSGVNAKLEHEADKIQRRMKSHYEMLHKELLALEKAETKVQNRLDNLIALENEIGLVHDLKVHGLEGAETDDIE